jgi:guanine deaminase
MDAFMKKAIEEAYIGIDSEDGVPFGAIIVKDGVVIATGHNEVVANHDPTAHAEIVAIRKACLLLERFDLSDCSLYTTCEPCPMCLGAILWAKIPTLYYGATRYDAAEIGFDDTLLYDIISGKSTSTDLELKLLDRAECLTVLRDYEKNAKHFSHPT